MADLTGSTIASSYDQLLALPSGGGDGSTLVALTDGNAGNTFALQVSTAGIKSTGTLNVAGITTMSGDLRLEDDAGGEYFGIGTPATVTTYTLTVPAAVGGSGQALRTSDGSGTLEWYTPETGDITGVTAGTGLSGGGTSGTVTLNVEASQTQITALGTIGTGVWQGTAVDGTYIDLEGTEVKSTGETGGTKFLREDGDGTCSWQTATATVTIDNTTIGSSTAGSVLFVNSSNQLSQDNDKLFWDATNFRLGIGTASPNARLEIEDGGTSDSVLLKVTADDDSPYSLMVGNDTYSTTDTDGIGMWINDAGVGKLHARGTGSSLNLGTAGVDRVYIDTSGNVGIGTTSSSGARVHINSAGDDVSLTAESTDSGAYVSFKDNASTNWYNTRIGCVADSFRIQTAATDRVIVDSSGNVGIGTTVPNGKLSVRETVTDTNCYIEVRTVANGGGDPYIKFDSGGTNFVVGEKWVGTTNNYLVLGPGDDTDITSGIFVKGDGNVGIGTTSPNTSLTIGGDNTISVPTSDGSDNSGLTLTGGGAAGVSRGAFVRVYGNEHATNGGQLRLYGGDISGGSMIFNVNGADVMTIAQADATAHTLKLSAGNVGIGGTPSHKLTAIDSTVTEGFVDVIGVNCSATGHTAVLGYEADGSEATHSVLRSANNLPLAFATNNTTAKRMVIDENGSIDLVASKLTIGGGNGDDGDVLTSDGAGNIAWEAASGGSSGVTALSEAATVTIDFSSTKLQTLTVTGTCTTLATSNRSAGKEVELRIYNNDGGFVGFTPTTPSWKEMGQSITSTGVDPTEYAILKLTSWGTTDADVTAELITQP